MLTEINAVLAGLNSAAGITRTLIKADSALEKADLKLKLSELMQHIAESQAQLADLKLESLSKDEKIRELAEKLEIKESLVRHNSVYYRADEQGNPTGEAYCSNCWDVENILVHILHPDYSVDLACPNCKQEYNSGGVQRVIEP